MNTLEAEKTIDNAISRSLAALTSEAGNDTSSIIHYLKQHIDSIHSHVPAWARFSNSLGLVAKFICFRARFWQFNRSYSQ